MIKTKQFKERLQAEKERLERMIKTRKASSIDHDRLSLNDSFSNSGDDEYADTATDTFYQELDVTIVHKYQHHLADVNAALQRIEAGTYGRCIRCQTEISEGRLDAIPETAYCRDCEADVEAQD